MNSKGLSSVVGAVLLITISVAAATSAWTFIDNVTEQTQQSVEDRINEDTREANTELTTEIAYNSSDGFTIVTLRNSGRRTITLQEEDGSKNLDMYIDGRPLNGDLEAWEFLQSQSGSVRLDPTESMPVNTTKSFPANQNEYEIQFNGPYGTSTTYVCYNSGTSSC